MIAIIAASTLPHRGPAEKGTTMKHALAAISMIALAGPVLAQSTEELAQEYVALPANQQMMEDMFSGESFAAQMAATLPPQMNLSDDQMQRIGAAMAGAMAPLLPQMEAAMLEATAQTFTVEELQAMIDFYGSEIGASILAKSPGLMQTAMARIAPAMMQMQQQVMPEIMAIMQE
jgi:hypothetical protein